GHRRAAAQPAAALHRPADRRGRGGAPRGPRAAGGPPSGSPRPAPRGGPARIGLCDGLVPDDQVRAAAHELAAEIAESAPLAVTSIRATMRGDLASRVRTATDREAAEQDRLRATSDWHEGVLATAERRPPRFQGR